MKSFNIFIEILNLYFTSLCVNAIWHSGCGKQQQQQEEGEEEVRPGWWPGRPLPPGLAKQKITKLNSLRHLPLHS